MTAKFTASSIKNVFLSRENPSKLFFFCPFCTEAQDDSDKWGWERHFQKRLKIWFSCNSKIEVGTHFASLYLFIYCYFVWGGLDFFFEVRVRFWFRSKLLKRTLWSTFYIFCFYFAVTVPKHILKEISFFFLLFLPFLLKRNVVSHYKTIYENSSLPSNRKRLTPIRFIFY